MRDIAGRLPGVDTSARPSRSLSLGLDLGLDLDLDLGLGLDLSRSRWLVTSRHL
ncbi:hypothetical protein ACLVWQ_10920 [Streptomyces sp. CWNU-52B]|uniref:hypothetical protein n=1 Tax=unclassified Streptomyces TaxID=2593676 RepID=UPI0039C00366